MEEDRVGICEHCAHSRKVVEPWKAIPRCANCRKPMLKEKEMNGTEEKATPWIVQAVIRERDRYKKALEQIAKWDRCQASEFAKKALKAPK